MDLGKIILELKKENEADRQLAKEVMEKYWEKSLKELEAKKHKSGLKKLLPLILFFFVTAALAQSPILVDPQSGKYLGNLNSNPYDPNSVSNPYGRYGSQYSPDSINNPYGQYGNPYSPRSIHNPYATTLTSPRIISPSVSVVPSMPNISLPTLPNVSQPGMNILMTPAGAADAIWGTPTVNIWELR